MSDKRPLRIAVIGASPEGFGARAHIPGIQAAQGVELLAVATAHDETARAAAEHWGIPRWYGGVEQLLADEDIDAVTVAVRPRSHYSLAKAAIEAGKAVYCEWPLALTTDEAVELTALASGGGVLTAVGLQGRWVPEMRHMRDLVAAGRIGRPLSFDVSQQLNRFDVAESRSWLAHEDEASGALFVASAHTIDAVRFILGDVASLGGLRATLLVDDRYSDTGKGFEWKASDTVRYVARLAGGQIGSLAVSNITTPPLGFTLRIYGEEGRLTATAPGYYQFTPMSLYAGTRGGDAEPVAIPAALRSGVDLADGHDGANVGRAVAAFSAAWREGARFRPDFEDGIGLHRIIDAVARSSDERRWVAVEDS